MHPYFLDRLARDHWDTISRQSVLDAQARRRGRRSRRSIRRRRSDL
ncbi:MAG TPA: hypothetical protein VM345_03290 [Acidimicrobiales bacterium]|nr:hypothetical protein [Acidimicrobiales bacterium]